MLLADADIEETRGEFLEEGQQAGAARHRRGDRDRALVRVQDLADGVGEDGRVLRGRRLRGAARGDPMPFHVVVFGRAVAVTLLRLHVNEDRTVAEVAGLFEHALDREEIVTIDRAEIREAELLEQDVRDEERFEAREDPAARLLRELAAGHVLEDLTRDVLGAPVWLGRTERFEHA